MMLAKCICFWKYEISRNDLKGKYGIWRWAKMKEWESIEVKSAIDNHMTKMVEEKNPGWNEIQSLKRKFLHWKMKTIRKLLQEEHLM